MCEFHFSFTSFVPTVEPKHLESEELGAEEFEDAIKKILTKTEESDLETLVRNFIQSKSPLKMTEAMEIVHF